jgi:hypothetical protein
MLPETHSLNLFQLLIPTFQTQICEVGTALTPKMLYGKMYLKNMFVVVILWTILNVKHIHHYTTETTIESHYLDVT